MLSVVVERPVMKPVTNKPSQTRTSPRIDVIPVNELATWTPERLAVRAADGCLASFGELVHQFQGRLYNFLLRRVASASEAEDLTQEAFVRAWERIKSYDPQWRFSTWLFTIGSRLAVSRHRSVSRAKPHVKRLAEERPKFHEEEADQRLSNREQFDRLWLVAEEKLSYEQRTALWLRYAEGLSIGEIATILSRSQVGVRVLLFRVRQTLIQHLAPGAEAKDETLKVREVKQALGLERRQQMAGALT